jgi:glycosyltransferase involved in cell wall biosynthesis
MPAMMKLSIITVCYNSEETISDTLRSIEKQTYNNIEYIIIDGGSTDGTVDLIKKSPAVTHYVSESDDGIYDAMNKGIKMATGDVIGTLNADDFYTDQNVLTRISEYFQDDAVDAVYADLIYVNQLETDKTVRLWKSESYRPCLFKQGWVPPHPTFFARKKVYDNFGYFNLKYQLAADFELLFRLVEVKKIKTVHIPHVLVKMRMGGATNKSFRNIFVQNKEILSVLKAHYSNFSAIKWVIYKGLDRVAQFVRSG